jgi:hypothetical protein
VPVICDLRHSAIVKKRNCAWLVKSLPRAT